MNDLLNNSTDSILTNFNELCNIEYIDLEFTDLSNWEIFRRLEKESYTSIDKIENGIMFYYGKNNQGYYQKKICELILLNNNEYKIKFEKINFTFYLRRKYRRFPVLELEDF